MEAQTDDELTDLFNYISMKNAPVMLEGEMGLPAFREDLIALEREVLPAKRRIIEILTAHNHPDLPVLREAWDGLRAELGIE